MTLSLFTRFLLSFFISSILTAALILIKRILRKHISTIWQYNMRFLFIAIFLLPFVPLRFFSAGLLLGRPFGIAAASNGFVVMPWAGENNTADVSALLQDFSISVENNISDSLIFILSAIWLIGLIACLVTLFFSAMKIKQIKMNAKAIMNTEINNIFDGCKEKLEIKRKLKLYQSELIQTPAAFGLFGIYIVLPLTDRLSYDDIKYALLHELQHYKNKDLPFNFVLCLMQSLYWFNPLVHLACRDMRSDREEACDASVLKRLDRGCFIGYGMAILSFAQNFSRPKPLILAAELMGTKKQITKRIEKIASFTEDSRRLKLKSAAVFMLALLMILSQSPALSVMAFDSGKYSFAEEAAVAYEDLSSFFNGFEGSFVLYDMEKQSYSVYNRERSLSRVSPDSTYKIYSALAALELGGLQNDTMPWDGTAYPFEEWNREQDLQSAMAHSVNWYFQRLDRISGIENLQNYFKEIEYGNADLSGGIDSYWLESSLRISPMEQAELLRKFYMNSFDFEQENIDRIKQAIRLSEKDGAILFGKTGTGSLSAEMINGWFIGYVEKNEQTFIFAANISGAGGSEAARIVLDILNARGIY